jgi:hypothetical protein
MNLPHDKQSPMAQTSLHLVATSFLVDHNAESLRGVQI